MDSDLAREGIRPPVNTMLMSNMLSDRPKQCFKASIIVAVREVCGKSAHDHGIECRCLALTLAWMWCEAEDVNKANAFIN